MNDGMSRRSAMRPAPARRRLALTALAALCVLAVAGLGHSATVAEFGEGIRRTKATAAALAKGRWNKPAEEKLVDRLDGLSDDFHDLAADGASLVSSGKALLDLMVNVHKRYTRVLEEMQAEVIRIDGDLEAVQDSDAWQDRELLAMRLLYRINWVRYEMATRYERNTGKRTELLKAARSGFAEFLGSGDIELTSESLLGHGLASKTLKDYDRAAADFEAVLADGPPGELQVRARVSLCQTLLAAGRITDALGATSTLLKAGSAGEVHRQALFLRAKALLLAVGRYASRHGSSERARMRAEAARHLEEMYRSGSYWRTKALQLIDSGIQNPGEWAAGKAGPFVSWLVAESSRRRGECPTAVALYESLLARGAYATESHYGIGFCAFHEGDYPRALDELSAFLDRTENGHAYRQQAAYLRFKSAESVYLKVGASAQEQATDRYLEALESYLDIAPKHAQAYEAWFRLGEWHRDRDEHAACADAFEQVAGDAAFQLKGMFLAAQCRAQVVLDLPADAEAETVTAAVAAADRFLEEAQAFRSAKSENGADTLLAPMEAKAVVIGAALSPRTAAGTMKERLERLRGFEERFPSESTTLPEVLALRIVAHRHLGDLDGAGAELERLLAQEEAGTYQHDALKKLGIVFLEEAAKRLDEDDAKGAARSRAVALTIYRRLLEESREGRLEAPIAGLEKLVADLEAPLL